MKVPVTDKSDSGDPEETGFMSDEEADQKAQASDGATIDGNSVRFKVPLMAMTKGAGIDVSATYEERLSKWVLPLAGGVILLLGGILIGRQLRK